GNTNALELHTTIRGIYVFGSHLVKKNTHTQKTNTQQTQTTHTAHLFNTGSSALAFFCKLNTNIIVKWYEFIGFIDISSILINNISKASIVLPKHGYAGMLIGAWSFVM
ncbi:unnamed protein product, partial [Meganyctiphanes norvegica]